MKKTLKDKFDVTKPTVLQEVFKSENVERAIRRMYSSRDKDDLVTHPLRRVLLLEYRQNLAGMISHLAPIGKWSPSRAYVCLSEKRSGGYREMVFPCLIDSIVGRIAIDALEPYITRDDDNQTFCGRSHANTNREPGDYENWFKVWRDYTSAIAQAAQDRGYAYVFDTDVSDFFPSIERAKAKQFLAQRTGVHSVLIELLFYCLESWLPRVGYSALSGIPIENNDISRLVAHNYLKAVDSLFVHTSNQHYLRYVDDTVVFVRSKEEAEEVKRKHHLALREIGLSPNTSKTTILEVGKYQAGRHRDFNLKIDKIEKADDANAFSLLVDEWYAKDRKETTNWDQIAKRLYRTAQRKNYKEMRRHIFEDLEQTPSVTSNALLYLRTFEVSEDEMKALFSRWKDPQTNVDRKIEIVKFLCDARFSFDASKHLSDFAVWKIKRKDNHPGDSYPKALLLLLLYKHGKRENRDKITSWASVENLEDEHVRLHFMYVFYCANELSPDLHRKLRHLSSSDIELTMRLCNEAKNGDLQNRKRVLDFCLSKQDDSITIEARYLPLLRLIFGCKRYRAENECWLRRVLNPKAKTAQIKDQVIRKSLEDALKQIIA